MVSATETMPSAEPIGTPTYRAYRLNGSGGIVGVDVLRARTDDEARALAARMTNGHGVDLWDRARFLESFPPLSVGAPGVQP